MTDFKSPGLDEVSWQRKIIQTERARGNFAGKWSSSVQVGKPDLIMHFPIVGGVLMEVKLFRGVPDDQASFNRKIDATDKQREELQKYEESGGCGVLGVVVDFGQGKARLYVLPWATERLDSTSPTARGGSGSWDRGAGFNVEQLVQHMRGNRI